MAARKSAKQVATKAAQTSGAGFTAEEREAISPKLWYGMPAYAKDGKVVCYFQNAGKFKARYSTLGFSDAASLDDGHMWPTAFALTEPHA